MRIYIIYHKEAPVIDVVWTKQYSYGIVRGTTEEVKSIAGYEGFYVTTEGRVFSAWRLGVRPLTADYSNLWEKKQFLIGRTRPSPYLHVSLAYNGKSGVYSVHRLVGLHFVNNPKPGVYKVVHHCAYPSNAAKDLMWTTQANNCEVGSKTKNHHLITPEGNTITIRNLAKFCRENIIDKASLYNHGKHKEWIYLGSL